MVRVCKLENVGPALVLGDLLIALKNLRVVFLCLQRQLTGDYLLSVPDMDQKKKLLQLGTIYFKDVTYWIDDSERKITFVNIFGTPFELSDNLLQQQLRKSGMVLLAQCGHYHRHPEVEKGIRNIQMFLCKDIPTTLQVGPLSLSVKYEGQLHTCNMCSEQGLSTVSCHKMWCYGCGKLGHCCAQCDRPKKCLYCGKDTHSSNICPEVFPGFSHQYPLKGPKVSTLPPSTPTPSSPYLNPLFFPPSAVPKPSPLSLSTHPPKHPHTTANVETSHPLPPWPRLWMTKGFHHCKNF